MGEARSAFYTSEVPVDSFTTDFTFQLLNPGADGFTFIIQTDNAQEVGDGAYGLGYGGIPNSAAIKFDLYDNAGEGTDSTGLYFNGAEPEVPAVDLSSTGIDLHSGDIFHVHIVYANHVATGTITDMNTGVAASTTLSGDLSQVVGSTAYVGFGGGTGALTATQNILTWTYKGGSTCH